jgi:mono/diheme cytochrome c family protein/cytochrome c553
MSRPTAWVLVITLTLVAAGGRASEPKGSAEAVFATTVLPVLKAKCLACHGDDPKKVKGGLDLSTRERLTAGGDSGKPGVAKTAADSPLYRSVLRTDAHFKPMPPKENDKLTDNEVSAIRAWVDGGAPWPTADRIAELVQAAKPNGVTVKTSGGLAADWTNRTYQPEDLWAYQPLKPAPGSTSVDRFINAKLDALGLTPAPPADRRTLVRRVTFDLTGLPPTPKEVDDFLADRDPDDRAFAGVVDRLMASPHYGERMAQHWLDVTRYADSSGFANDYERGNAWRYRDYVVRSFNADTPYADFVTEQIAGDEIAPDDPEKLVAVGFLRMGAWELTGMEVAKVARQRFLDDVTDAVGQVFLGHMLQCARCHDHKFDPVPTRDYYRVQAAFATTQLAERPAAFAKSENTAGFDEKKYLDARRKGHEAELARITKAEADARAAWEKANPDKRGQKPPRHEFLSAADLGKERIARKGLERLKWEYDRYEPVALSVYSGVTPQVKAMYAPFRMPKEPTKGTAEASHILAGGDPFSPKEAVTPGVLSAALDGTIPQEMQGRRKALAEWVVNPKNPLTARVMANRVWQWTTGRPLAGNPNNFGATGKRPTHPELLDWLAGEFVAGRWSVKSLQRKILLSDAYRRSSAHPDPKAVAAKDPTGTSYARFTPRRLTAEELRDAMLAASGELTRTVGGIPVRPEMNPDVAFQPRQVMGTFAPAWEPSPLPEQRHRRTLYALTLRGVRDPLQEVFNAPSPELPCEARESSTVAPQAFALFNGEASRGRALALAARLTKEAKGEDAVLTLAFKLSVGRPPTEKELAACMKHWKAMTERHKALTFEKPKRPAEITREAVEENTGEKFTFTERLHTAADFVPDSHPAEASAELRGLMEVCLVLFNTNEFITLD